jgi:hypothetical protein
MIYLVRCGNAHKIGYSEKPERRAVDLQIGNPEEVTLVRQWKGGRRIERAAHEFMAHKRTRGEWFDLTDADIEALDEFIKTKAYETRVEIKRRELSATPMVPHRKRGRQPHSVPDPFKHFCVLCWRKLYFNIKSQSYYCKCGAA